MHEHECEIAGLRTICVEHVNSTHLTVVLLHGYAMRPEALAPFAHSLGLRATFLVPEGPVRAGPAGSGWWEINESSRALALAGGPRDLHGEYPAGASSARRRLLSFVAESRERWPATALAVVGFSQGGMLACDTVLREEFSIAALALLSSSRISASEWAPLASRLRGLPILVSHGRQDQDLAFQAGEALRDFVASGGATVTWVPHEGGHEIPLVVWRQLKQFLSGLA